MAGTAPHPRLEARRLAKGLLIATLVFGLTGGTMGALAADGTPSTDGPSLEEQVQGFQVPAPREGDRLVYARSTDDGVVVDTIVEWRGEETVYDAHGYAHAAHEVRVVRPDRTTFNDAPKPIVMDVYLDAETGLPVTWTRYANHSQPGQPVPTGDSTQTFTRTDTGFANWSRYQPAAYLGTGPNHVLCGLRNPVQTTPYDDGVDLFANCTLNVHFPLWRPIFDTYSEFHPRERGRIGDFDAVRFGLEWGEEFDPRAGYAPLPQVDVWMSQDVPYPLRIEYSRNTSFPDSSMTLSLVEFTAGATPLAVPSASTADLGEIPVAPRQPWGPDDRGFTLGFSPSEAWNRALDHPTDDSLRSFTEAHPDARTVEAHYWTSRNDVGHESGGWQFIVSDAHDAVAICISDWYGLGHLEDSLDCDEERPDPIDPDCGGHLVPSWAGAVERWRAIASPRYAENGVTYLIFKAKCDSIEPWNVQLYVTSRESGFVPVAGAPPDVTEPNRTVSRSSTLFVTADGDAQWLMEHTSAHSWSPTGADEPPESEPVVASQGEIPAESAPWVTPSAESLASAGAFAALVAALYLLWPKITSLAGAALYSRVAKPEALDQPSRALVAEAIMARPGIHFRQLVRATGLSRGTVDHHLRKLIDTGLIAKRRNGRYACYFPAGDVDRRLMDALPFLKSDGARRLVNLALQEPGFTVRLAMRETGFTRQAIHAALRKLESVDVVACDRAEDVLRVHPTFLTEAVHRAAAGAED